MATNRPFQDEKVCGELVCSKCIEINEEVKFFDDVGPKKRFKVYINKHRSLKFNDSHMHSGETLHVVKQLSNLRLETVCKY
jgi:hypothetical protein